MATKKGPRYLVYVWNPGDDEPEYYEQVHSIQFAKEVVREKMHARGRAYIYNLSHARRVTTQLTFGKAKGDKEMEEDAR